MVDEMLIYQKKDSELINIERDIQNSQIKKVVNKMVDLVKEAQSKLIAIEKNAGELRQEFETTEKAYNAGVEQAEKLAKVKQDSLNEEELKSLSATATALNSNLLNLEKNMLTLNGKINAALVNFENVKKQGMQAKQKHAEGLKAHDQFLGTKQPEINKIKADLKALEAKADKAMLEKYNKLRNDKIFPIFVPLMDKSCGGCSMELPSARVDALKKAGCLECENCRRVIYFK